MYEARSRPPLPTNEPVLSYRPGSAERQALKSALAEAGQRRQALPMWIGGAQVAGDARLPLACPHRHGQVVGELHTGGAGEVARAIDAAGRARRGWGATPFDERAAVFLRAAELLTGRHRARMTAATMLGQSKTVHQAEIDAICELADFWRFNVHFASGLFEMQPQSSAGTWNRLDYRPLDGFVLAVAPFNFTAIAGNLACAPALMGNTVVLKPAGQAALAAQVMMEVLEEAGLPPGVINLVQAPGATVGDVALTHRELAGLHFTGSTGTFMHMWQQVGQHLERFRCYPRLVGETGGKDFVVAHPSCDLEALAVALVRGAFEYQGQKCSAASRAYVPDSLWPQLLARLQEEVARLTFGDVACLEHFMGALIDARSFARVRSYIELARNDAGCDVVIGGGSCDTEGYFVEPTVVTVDDPRHRLMQEEIFGPVLSIYRYPEGRFDEVLTICDQTSPFGLTGAIFARDPGAIGAAIARLRFAAGNLVINDKPTAAVVGQQPFGGGRRSGTNDKAGSPLNLLRWTSARTIKETFVPARQVAYPHQQASEEPCHRP